MNQINQQSAVHPALTILDAVDLSNVHALPGVESVLEPFFNGGRTAAIAGAEEFENPHTGATVAWSAWAYGWHSIQPKKENTHV